MLPDLAQFIWIGWLSLVVLFLVIELLTLEFTFLMLAAGALLGGLGTNLAGAAWWVQILAAGAVAALLLFTIRPLLLRVFHRSSRLHPTNVDALHGMTARVLQPFVDGAGMVKLDNGETWTARLLGGPVDVGESVVVTAVSGATVEVRPSEKSNSS